MKRSILLASLLLLSVPLVSAAHDNDRHPRRISATEIGAIGSGIAAFLGVAGYLVLRRRKAA